MPTMLDPLTQPCGTCRWWDRERWKRDHFRRKHAACVAAVPRWVTELTRRIEYRTYENETGCPCWAAIEGGGDE